MKTPLRTVENGKRFVENHIQIPPGEGSLRTYT